MNDRQKIDCASPADRNTLVVILARRLFYALKEVSQWQRDP